MMITGKARVSSKGWVVIPKEIRDEMDIHSGDEVSFIYWPPFVGEGKRGFGVLRLMPMRPEKLSDLRGKYRDRPGDRPWAEAFFEEKRREIEREERKVERPQRKKTGQARGSHAAATGTRRS
jgi:AbrB family looped-hinge helix DNA binding protein